MPLRRVDLLPYLPDGLFKRLFVGAGRGLRRAQDRGQMLVTDALFGKHANAAPCPDDSQSFIFILLRKSIHSIPFI